MPEWRASAVGETSSTPKPVELPGRPAAVAGADAVRYVAEFEDPREGDDDVAVLHLNGCYARTEVEVAGSLVGPSAGPVTHDIYYEPLRVPFYPADECRVVVTCEAPTDRFGGLHDTDRVSEVARVPAPWWAADIETHPLPFIDRVDIKPRASEKGAVLDVRTTLVAAEQVTGRVTYSLRPAGDTAARGMMERAAVETDGPGRTTVQHEIPVHDPTRWWPRELGDQHRYVLRASLGESERTVTTGIRSVSRDGDDLLVNGEPVAVRGVNLTTADVEDVERALECNATLVRGHAQVLPPAVYEACTERGLLVWQDLPLFGPGDFDVDRGREHARALDRTCAHHPALALAAVHDDPTDAFSVGLGSGILDTLRRRWRAWRIDDDHGPAERVAAALPNGVPTLPAVGDPGTGTEARRLFPGWDYGDAADAAALVARYPTWLVAEFGAGAIGTGDGGPAPEFDPAKVRGEAGDSRAAQAAVVGTVAESFRLAGVGAVQYALRDTLGAGLGLYAADGEPKPARAALATAFEPLQAFLVDPGAAESAVVVVNDLPAPFDAELAWTAGEASGRKSVNLEARDRWTGGRVRVPERANAVELELQTEAGTVTNRYEGL